MKHFFYCFFIISIYFSANCQSTYSWGGLGYGALGTQTISFDNEMSILQDVSTYRDEFRFQFGGGGLLLLKSKYIILGQGYGSIYSKESSSGSEIIPTYGGGGFNFGYCIINKRALLLYPSIGIGAAAYNVEVKNSSQTDLNFGSQVIGENETGNYQLANSYLDINLNIHKLFVLDNEELDANTITIGFTLGYQLAINENHWKTQETNEEITDLPFNKANTLYLRLLIGGGGFTF